MGQNQRGKRNGTGPFKESFQRQNSGEGRRQQAGETCPATVKKPSRHGTWWDKRSG